MDALSLEPPRVFLSSVFKDFYSDARELVPLRQRILENESRLPVRLWAYELFWREDEFPKPDAGTVIDRCFAGVKSCDLFVFLMSERHGTRIPYAEGGVLVTYVELELLLACLFQKPIVVLHSTGREAEPPLADALTFLRTKSSSFYALGDDNRLYEKFVMACDLLAKKNLPPSSEQRQLVDYLSVHRSRAHVVDDIDDPALAFLGSAFWQRAAQPDIAKVEALLAQLGEVRSPSSNAQGLPHGAAIFRLWSAMRELIGTGERTSIDPATAALWDRCLGVWAGRTSWFGLHGHVWMGPLAAVNSQTALRSKFAKEPAFSAMTDVREPAGSRASAIYSVAGKMQRRERKLFHYEEAMALAKKAIDTGSSSEEGARSIRGHAAMQLARMGRVWNFWSAKKEFSRSLELRVQRHGVDSLSAGEGMMDLGLCLVLTGVVWKGYPLMNDGLVLLRKAKSANERSFLMRGLRQFELASRILGRREEAASARDELLVLAKQTDAFDQLRLSASAEPHVTGSFKL